MSLAEKVNDCSKTYSSKRKTFYDSKGKSVSNYKVENEGKKKFSMIQIDDCVFTSNETKCDYGMIVAEQNVIYFIELKGSDNNKGLEQLYQTLINTKEHFKTYQKQVRLIVSKSETPRDLNKNLIDKIATITGDIMNGKKKTFIKTNNTYTEII